METERYVTCKKKIGECTLGMAKVGLSVYTVVCTIQNQKFDTCMCQVSRLASTGHFPHGGGLGTEADCLWITQAIPVHNWAWLSVYTVDNKGIPVDNLVYGCG